MAKRATSLNSARAALVAAQQQARAELDALRAKHDTLTAHYNAVLAQPLSRTDLETVLAAEFQREQDRAARDPETIALVRELAERAPANWLNLSDAPTYSPLARGRWDDQMARLVTLLLGDPAALVARLAPVLDALDFSAAGAPIEVRRQRLEQIASEISEVGAEIQAMSEELRAAGIDTTTKTKTSDTGPRIGDTRVDGPDARDSYSVGVWGFNPALDPAHHSPGWIWVNKVRKDEIDATIEALRSQQNIELKEVA